MNKILPYVVIALLLGTVTMVVPYALLGPGDYTSLTDEGEFIKFEFEDWGIGISDRLKENILTGIDERVLRVSGVGLTLVKQIVDQYNGKVWVEDRVKGNFAKGTRVAIMLPNGC